MFPLSAAVLFNLNIRCSRKGAASDLAFAPALYLLPVALHIALRENIAPSGDGGYGPETLKQIFCFGNTSMRPLF